MKIYFSYVLLLYIVSWVINNSRTWCILFVHRRQRERLISVFVEWVCGWLMRQIWAGKSLPHVVQVACHWCENLWNKCLQSKSFGVITFWAIAFRANATETISFWANTFEANRDYWRHRCGCCSCFHWWWWWRERERCADVVVVVTSGGSEEREREWEMVANGGGGGGCGERNVQTMLLLLSLVMVVVNSGVQILLLMVFTWCTLRDFSLSLPPPTTTTTSNNKNNNSWLPRPSLCTHVYKRHSKHLWLQ